MRREATIRTWRSENFFSSSRVRLEEGREKRVSMYVWRNAGVPSSGKGIDLPLLGAVPALKERDGDENDNGLATVADLDL
jgi:hypothetical protein